MSEHKMPIPWLSTYCSFAQNIYHKNKCKNNFGEKFLVQCLVL